jgi:predicted dehydrogenase
MRLARSLLSPSDIIGVRSDLAKELPNTPSIQDISSHPFIRVDDFSPDSKDYVIICNPSSLHFSTYIHIRRLNKECNVLIEKPLAVDPHALKQLSASQDRNVYVAFQYRYLDVVKWLRNTLIPSLPKDDAYNIHITHSDNVTSWHPWEDYQDSYSVKSSLGGGCFNTLCHSQDLIHYIFLQPDILSIHTGNSMPDLGQCDDWTIINYLVSLKEHNKQMPATLFNSYTSYRPIFTFDILSRSFEARIDCLANSLDYDGNLPCKPLSLSDTCGQSAASLRDSLFFSLLNDFLKPHSNTELPRATTVASSFLPYYQ